MPNLIEDYALVGDCETAALVSQHGSIDWLCFPRFDSPAFFAALLGSPENGRWRISPSNPAVSSTRRYRPGTLILETTFETGSGAATIVDFMPPRCIEDPGPCGSATPRRVSLSSGMQLLARGRLLPDGQACRCRR